MILARLAQRALYGARRGAQVESVPQNARATFSRFPGFSGQPTLRHDLTLHTDRRYHPADSNPNTTAGRIEIVKEILAVGYKDMGRLFRKLTAEEDEVVTSGFADPW